MVKDVNQKISCLFNLNADFKFLNRIKTKGGRLWASGQGLKPSTSLLHLLEQVSEYSDQSTTKRSASVTITGESKEFTLNTLPEDEACKWLNLCIGFETRGRCHQMCKTGTSVTPQKD